MRYPNAEPLLKAPIEDKFAFLFFCMNGSFGLNLFFACVKLFVADKKKTKKKIGRTA